MEIGQLTTAQLSTDNGASVNQAECKMGQVSR